MGTNRYVLRVSRDVFQTHGKVQLATRTLVEMDIYIHQLFPDHAMDCNVCKRLCIQVRKQVEIMQGNAIRLSEDS